MVLRDYQQECVDLIDNLKSGSYLISMATGLGKTVVFSAIKRKGRVLIISHREELVNQPIKYYDCPCGIEQAKSHSKGEEVVSASVQTLIKRLDKFSPTDFDTIITDEAHHAAAKSYKKIYDYFTPRLHLGFTATPNRGDKVRLDDVFESIIFERNLKWGITHDYLTNIYCLRVKVSWNLKPVKVSMGDFMVGQLDNAINQEGINSQIADIYQKYAKGQTLIFATSVEHAENIAKLIKGAVVVSQKTKNRQQIIKDFTQRKIPCIVNCMIFTEGTDMPLIETIIIARPTKNQSLYAQMVGRGLRKYEGKKYLTLIDLVGVSDDLDICTAPSLLGLDMSAVPSNRRNKIEGLLTNLNDVIDSESDCAINWVTNVYKVKLFGSLQGVDLHDINWTQKPNGDLVYQFTSGDRIGIKAIDEVGKTKVMYYTYSQTQNRFVYSESDLTTLQHALNMSYDYFRIMHDDERAFWDLANYYNWQYQPATEKQLEYIKSKLPKADFDQVYKGGLITKGDATQIINALKIKNATPYELMQMHKKSVEKENLRQQKEQEYAEKIAHLKVEYMFTTKYRNKFYAIKHPTRLVITDSWDICLGLVDELQGLDGERCLYKKFPSKAQALAFLKKGV